MTWTTEIIDGFDHLATGADALAKWGGGLIDLNGGTLTPGASYARSPGQGISCHTTSNGSGFNSAYVERALTTNGRSVVIGFAFKPFTRPNSTSGARLVRMMNAATPHLELNMINTGQLQVLRGGTLLATQNSALPTSEWHFVEFRGIIGDLDGAYEVRIDGVTVPELTATGMDTRNGTTTGATHVWFGLYAHWNTVPTFYYDDVYLRSSSSAETTGFYGDGRVQTLLPSGAGASTGFTPLAGANYANVDEVIQNGDTDYVETATSGAKDTYAMADLVATTTTVEAVQVTPVARMTDAGPHTIKPVVRTGGADYASPAQSLTTAFAPKPYLWATNPATGLPWTPAEVNAAEAGMEHG